MTRTMRRILGGFIALAAILAAAASMPGVEQTRLRNAMLAGQGRARSELALAREALDTRIRRLETRVAAAANRKEVGYMLAALRPADPLEPVLRTLENGFRDEPWWDSFRREFPITALSFDTDPPELVIGAERQDLKAGPLIAQSRAQGLSSGIVLVNDSPYAAAADPLTVTGRPPVILLLARPLDETFLTNERPDLAVALDYGGRVIASAGAPEAVTVLTQATIALARNSDSPGKTPDDVQVQDVEDIRDAVKDKVASAPDSTWVAIRRPLGPRLGLSVHVKNTEAALQAARTATTMRIAIWGGALFIALLALFLAFRQRVTGAQKGAEGAADMFSTAATSTSTTAGVVGTPSGQISRPSSQLRSMGGAMAVPSVSGIAGTQVFTAQPNAPAPGSSGGDARTFGRHTLLDSLGEGAWRVSS